MINSAILGFPRIGARRELKKATEAYWKGETSAQDLRTAGTELRAVHWRLQQQAGIDIIPSNDFSFYDHVLDTIAMVGAVPDRFGHEGGAVDLDLVFAMARGTDDAVAMEMTKWFDTNYHYIVPEFGPDQTFSLAFAQAARRVRRGPGARHPHPPRPGWGRSPCCRSANRRYRASIPSTC